MSEKQNLEESSNAIFDDMTPHSNSSRSISKNLKTKIIVIRKTPSVTLLVLTFAGFLICIFLALISIPLHKYGGFPDYTGFILMLSLFAIIGLANSIHPPKIGTPRKYSNKVWVHRALAKTPLWLQLILVFYWIIVFILIPV